jgi:hypothetical protein
LVIGRLAIRHFAYGHLRNGQLVVGHIDTRCMHADLTSGIAVRMAFLYIGVHFLPSMYAVFCFISGATPRQLVIIALIPGSIEN